jgi:hypothetical protein
MPITDQEQFIDYDTFKNEGVVVADTFNSWRKKTNGIINELDDINIRIEDINITNITPNQLSLGAPTWLETGDLFTYKPEGEPYAPFTAGDIIGTNLKIGSGGSAAAAGAVNATSLAIGTNNTQFTVSSTGSVTAPSFNSTSSIRFKENIQPLNNALQIIQELQGVTFDWKETGQSDIGLIAEDVNKVLPQFVLKDELGIPQAIDYGKLTSVLIEAVKELAQLVSAK